MADTFGTLDVGRHWCHLTELCRKLIDNGRPISSAIVDFAHNTSPLMWHAERLFDTIGKYNKFASDKTTTTRARIASLSGASNIMWVNSDPSTLLSFPREKASLSHQDILTTGELLNETRNYSKRPFDLGLILKPERLVHYHRKLGYGDGDENEGFRTSGAQTKSQSEFGDVKIHLHHSLIPYNLDILSKIVSKLCQHVDDSLERSVHTASTLLLTFSVAAFAQYHLHDIHPFSEGNDHVIDMVVRNILESICPLPFVKRKQNLRGCRVSLGADDGVSSETNALLHLAVEDMLHSAYVHLEEAITILQLPYDICASACDASSLTCLLTTAFLNATSQSAKINADDVRRASEAFNLLAEDQNCIVPVRSEFHSLRVKIVKLARFEVRYTGSCLFSVVPYDQV